MYVFIKGAVIHELSKFTNLKIKVLCLEDGPFRYYKNYSTFLDSFFWLCFVKKIPKKKHGKCPPKKKQIMLFFKIKKIHIFLMSVTYPKRNHVSWVHGASPDLPRQRCIAEVTHLPITNHHGPGPEPTGGGLRRVALPWGKGAVVGLIQGPTPTVKLTSLAGKWTLNEEVFPIKHRDMTSWFPLIRPAISTLISEGGTWPWGVGWPAMIS